MIDIGILPRHQARFRPDHIALSVGGEDLTFSQFNIRVNQLANGLLAAGIGKGDKVSTVMTNRIELATMFWAAAKTGIIIVPSSPLLQDEGLKTLFLDSDTSLVIANAEFADSLDRIRADLPNIQSDRFVLAGVDAPREGFRSYEDLMDEGSDSEPPDADLKADDIYNIMYSSGTTGQPKGIMHSHFVRSNYCTLFASAFRMTPESVILHAGSMVFNGAMIDFMPWMFLGCHYIMHEAFDVERFMNEIAVRKVTHVIMVPSQIMAMLNHPAFDAEKLSSLEMIQSLGAPLLLEYKHRLNDLLPGRFYELYGLTEGFITVLDKNEAIRKAGSVGVPLTFYDMKIMDEDGNEVPTGEIGEICGKGPLLTPGYYGRPELTQKTIVDGWLHSGDVGYVDEDGYLYLVDRIKDMIISGGVNVYPKDIEETIIGHPDVTEVAVFGVADDKWGEVPVAAVTLVAGSDLDPADLVPWTNERVSAKFQRISDCFALPEFPRNVAGKTLKREIQDNYKKA